MLTFIVSISFAQYTPMTAAGYQFKRILCDSTLHIPSFCGIPTLRNSTAKNGAIAMDTCNYKIYMWTNAVGWGEIIGAGTDTTSLSLRIDQRVKYTDTAQMLLAYLRKQDTANRFVANVTKVNDSTIRVFKGNTITDLKILGKGTDTTSLSNRIDARVKFTDTAAMLLPYLRKVDTTAMLSKYLRKTDTASLSNRINLKLNISDTATMLSKYLRKTDTTNRFVNAVTKVNDSTIRVFKGSTSTDIELPRGSGGGGGSGTVISVGTGYGLSGGPITSTGTIIVDSATLSTKYLRRADTSNLVATKSNVALKLNIADTATMLSKYLRKVDTASLSNRINLKVNISDTATMLSNYLRKIDTASLSNRINLKVNISDTATMLSKYLRKTDTASLSNRINLKVNISDTASMLSPYLREIDTTNKFVNNVTKINDSTIRVFKGTGSTDLLIRGNASSGPVTTPTLQQVTTAGATTDLTFTGYGISNLLQTDYNSFESTPGYIYYPLKYSDIAVNSGSGYIKAYDENTGAIQPEIRFRQLDGFTLNPYEVSWDYSGTKIKLMPTEGSLPTSNYDIRLPVFDNGVTPKDTLATLRDVRNGGGGGGTGTVTSVDLTMPSAFSVTGNPVTTSGTLAVTGAGTVSQYVRGDGTLANFPNSTGGGSSINYYLNGSVSQGTFGGDTYYEMSKTPILGAGTNFVRTNGAGNGYIASFITDAGDPSQLNIPGGNWNLEFYFQSSASGGTPQFYGEIYKVSASNVFTLVASGSANPEGITNGTAIDQYFTSISVPATTLLITDRIAVRIFVITGGRTLTLHTENGNLCEVLTTFTTGLTALNGLTEQVQNFATGTSGTDFAISSASGTHTFNLPTASASNRGALSSANWTTFNNKIGSSDTSVFQRKSISAYTMLANNTNATANATAQTFRDTAGTYAGTITWTGTAPTTQTINYYQWQQTGKWVRLQIFGSYTNAGSAITALQLTIPADCPAPDISMFQTAANAILYNGIGGLGLSATGVTLTTNAYMRRNAANNGNELFISVASNNYRRYQIDITYRVQ